MLTQCVRKADVNNYSVMAIGQWSCEDKVLKGHSPLSPLDEWGMGSEDGPNAGNFAGGVRKTFYQSLFALVLSTLMFGKMSRGEAQGRGKLPAVGNSPIE